MYIKYLLIIAISSASLSTPFAFAQNWEAELGLSAPEGLGDNVYNAQITYYLKPLSASGSTPLAEAPFVDRVSSLTFDVSTYDTHSTPFASRPTFPQIELRQEMNAYGLSYTRRSPSTAHSFGAGFAFHTQEVETLSSYSWTRPIGLTPFPNETPIVSDVVIDRISQNTFIYLAEYNYYLQPQWTVGTAAALEERALSDTITVALTTKRIWTLNKDRSFALSAGINRSERKTLSGSGDRWNAGATASYYISPETSFSFGLELPEGGDSQLYRTGIQHFFNEKAFARLNYQLVKVDLPSGFTLPPETDFDDSIDEFQAAVGIRF